MKDWTTAQALINANNYISQLKSELARRESDSVVKLHENATNDILLYGYAITKTTFTTDGKIVQERIDPESFYYIPPTKGDRA